ncbi:hypothetical protein GCM10012287_37500 [Streptomyces daqingensis]|uniref:SUKH-4 immunity protein n=1 Tax=Streptomyces daqingensis TaxID=1472640 RepID=A0ABQ2MID9_9ACTN|nr:hypothetical protein [Streptomyces daqingensis]GGO52675.1 hypothetical protein GCM10012287_37500 [Streptomyces daqingensis]
MVHEHVRDIYTRAARTAFLDREAVRGAGDAELEQLVGGQRLDSLPAAAGSVLRLVGGAKGPWFLGERLVLADADPGGLKEAALGCGTQETGAQLHDTAGMLVLTCHDGTRYEVVDGCDLSMADPPVWILDGTGDVQKSCGSLTEWFSRAADRVVNLSKDVARRARQGRPTPPWARYFTISASTRPGRAGDRTEGGAESRP